MASIGLMAWGLAGAGELERESAGAGQGQRHTQALTLSPSLAPSPTPCLRVYGITERTGDLRIAIYNRREAYMDESRMFRHFVVALDSRPDKTIELPLSDLPDGEYAISCYQDKNRNGRLDRNLFGAPAEPYGFSRRARPKFRAPTWDETKIRLSAQTGGQCLDLEIKS